MIFYNIGDGYSSGCCTGNLYKVSQDDPKYFGARDVEHPDNKPGSFVNHLAELYKARTITVGRHNLTMKDMLDNLERYESEIQGHNDQVIAWIGIPNLTEDTDKQYLEMFIQRISNIGHKVIVYRTTHMESLDLNLPNNVTFLNESIVETLSQEHKPYRRGYFDKEANKSLKGSFLKLL